MAIRHVSREENTQKHTTHLDNTSVLGKPVNFSQTLCYTNRVILTDPPTLPRRGCFFFLDACVFFYEPRLLFLQIFSAFWSPRGGQKADQAGGFGGPQVPRENFELFDLRKHVFHCQAYLFHKLLIALFLLQNRSLKCALNRFASLSFRLGHCTCFQKVSYVCR